MSLEALALLAVGAPVYLWAAVRTKQCAAEAVRSALDVLAPAEPTR